MLTLARASDLLNRMPNKFLVKEISKRECEELWEFVNTTDKLSISQHRLKTAMADECGVMLDNYSDIKVGDIIETFEEVSTSRKL